MVIHPLEYTRPAGINPVCTQNGMIVPSHIKKCVDYGYTIY
jgi:hypothetical protein